MNSRLFRSTFIKNITAEALNSAAVNHPYLRALRHGDLPNVDLALRDFAFQYGLYSSHFVSYLLAVISNLGNAEHREILQANLAEERGNVHNVELPSDVLFSVEGQLHAQLYQRFQESLGIDAIYRESTPECHMAILWNQQFLQLCELNECVGIGAIGIGTELIVSSIYKQILEGLKAHTDLTMTQHVFFDLHCQCDEEHASQMLLIAEDLAQTRKACEQIEYGVREAVNMRANFWSRMLERAQSLPASITSL